MAEAGRVSVKLNLKEGAVEIDCPLEEFEGVVSRVKELMGASGEARTKQPNLSSSEEAAKAVRQDPSAATTNDKRGGQSRQKGGSSGRPGRIGSFEPVNLGFSEQQERELREFFEQKKPTEQVDQVACAMYKGEDLLQRKAFSFNEIYTIMKLAGVKPLPKAIDVVLGRMISDNWAVKEGSGFSTKFVGRDHVEGLSAT